MGRIGRIDFWYLVDGVGDVVVIGALCGACFCGFASGFAGWAGLIFGFVAGD